MAFLLALFFLAGDRAALTADPKGWVDILPGPRLEGWTRVEPISTAGVVSHVDPGVNVWVVDRRAGVLECRGDLPPAPAGGKPGSHEMLRHDRELGDFIFHLEWRFTDPSRPGLNGGVYARVNAPVTVWHEAQIGGSNVYLFGDTPDEAGKIVRRKTDSRSGILAPAGAWNTYEITGRGDRLSLWVNGAVVSQMDVRVRRGHVGLEAEYHHIQFRNLKLKER